MSEELERLRQKGARRLAEADRERQAALAERDAERLAELSDAVRLAVGRYHYRLLRSLLAWVAIACGVIGIGCVFVISIDGVPPWIGAGFGAGLALAFAGLQSWSSEMLWRAWPGTMQAENAWLRSRPFAIRGYFEWLGDSDDRSGASLTLIIHMPTSSSMPPEEIQLLIAAIHPQVTHDLSRASYRLGGIPTREDDRRVALVHELVDRVLVPLHHEASIESIDLS